ncbi:hypothetical protein BC835DRAFT_1302624 [Cytidiella melzeri]|nr:hypothetical protein BC835DRAFT_1302624 [Cytidiella melzeri]
MAQLPLPLTTPLASDNDAQQGKDEEDVVESTRLSLSSLLNPKRWDLPGWDSTTAPMIPTAETIEQLDLSIALLSRYRNTLRPLHRLSPDVLIMIFSELENDHWDPFNLSFGSYSWMVVAKVCHAWREVVLRSPIFWRQLNTKFPSAALTALERSGDSGICLAIHYDSYSDDALKAQALAVVEAVAKQMHRLRWLYVRSDILKTDNDQISYLLQPLVKHPAPMLEHLITQKVRVTGGTVPLPTLFGGHTPQLHRLRVHYVRPQLNSVALHKIKYLEFCGRKHTPIVMDISAFLDILEKCPSLKFLDVVKVSWQPAAEEDERKVQLGNLKYLNMGREKASVVADILDRLVIPECAFKLQVWYNRYEDNKFHIGVPAEHLLSINHPLRNITKMHLQFLNGYEGVLIKGQTKEMPFEIHGLLESDTVAHLGDMDAISGTVFQSIVRSFDLENVEEFCMTEMRSNSRWTTFTKKVWTELFRKMPNLKGFSMYTDPCYDEGFYRSILAALSAPDERTGKLLCPELERLTVCGDKTWSSLQCFRMAQTRHDAGCPIKQVSMRLAHYASFDDPEDTDLPLLRQYVETVDLNPVELTFPDWPDLST